MNAQIAASAVIHPNVSLGAGVVVEDYCIVGAPFRGYAGEATVIGEGALIRSHTVLYAGSTFGRSFQTGHHACIREFTVVGDEVSVGTHSVVEHRVRIGDRVRIHSGAFIPEFSLLEDDAWIGPHAVLTNATYPGTPTAKSDLRGPVIRAGAKIGANATILPGVVVGAGALVGAGSVVTADVQPAVVVAGNPARLIGPLPY